MRALPDAGSSAHPHQLLPLLLGPSPYDTSPRDEPMCLGGQLLSSTDTRTTGGVRAATLWPLSPHSPKLGDTPALGLWGAGRMHSTRPPAASYPAGTGQAEGSRCVPSTSASVIPSISPPHGEQQRTSPAPATAGHSPCPRELKSDGRKNHAQPMAE